MATTIVDNLESSDGSIDIPLESIFTIDDQAGNLLVSVELATSVTLTTIVTDIPGMTAIITTGSRPIAIEFGGSIRVNQGSLDSAVMSLLVDGAVRSQIISTRDAMTHTTLCRRLIIGPYPAGTVLTIKAQGFTTAGTGNLVGIPEDRAYMYVSNA